MILTRNTQGRVQLAEYNTDVVIAYQAAGTQVWLHDLSDALALERSLPSILKLAIEEACDWHKEQVYEKEPFTPYILHCWEVNTILKQFVDNPSMEEDIGAWHHDLFEDTAYPLAKHQTTYGEATTSLVQACTGHGVNRKMRQASIHQQLLAHPAAIDIKLADRAVNMSYAKNNPKLGPVYAAEAPKWDTLTALSGSSRLINHWYSQRDNLPDYIKTHGDLQII